MKFIPILLILILLISAFVVDGAKDRKKKKQQRHESAEDEREGGGFGSENDKEKDQKDRVHSLVERQEERNKEKAEKESSSSEEKDEKDEKSNGTEIVIPRFKRLTFTLKKQNAGNQEEKEMNNRYTYDVSEEMAPRKINLNERFGDVKATTRRFVIDASEKAYVLPTDDIDDEIEADNRTKRRTKRADDTTHTIKKAKELNDGEQIAIENRPKVETKNKK